MFIFNSENFVRIFPYFLQKQPSFSAVFSITESLPGAVCAKTPELPAG